jgi:acyl-ACP thioesterase
MANEENTPVYSATYRLHTNYVDGQKKLSLPGLFIFLQEIAWEHATQRGFGYARLKAQGQFWVLAKVKVLLYDYPQWNDELRIDTWSKAPELLTAYRDFEGYDTECRSLFSATSAWHILSEGAHRPQRVDALKQSFLIPENKHAIAEKLAKLPAPETTAMTTLHNVLWSDIDVNMHVNNSRFVQWVIDSFPASFLLSHRIVEIEVNFLQQAVLGDQYYIVSQEINPTTFITSVFRADGQKELARVRTVWRCFGCK